MNAQNFLYFIESNDIHALNLQKIQRLHVIRKSLPQLIVTSYQIFELQDFIFQEICANFIHTHKL